MRHSTFVLLAAGIGLFAVNPSLHAQDADETDVQVVEAMFIRAEAAEPSVLNVEFAGSGDSMTAALTVPSAPGFRMEMDDLKVGEKTLTFSFLEPGGTSIGCELMKLDDESWRGECDAGGVPIEMTIDPFDVSP